jgi:hypothetical protein
MTIIDGYAKPKFYEKMVFVFVVPALIIGGGALLLFAKSYLPAPGAVITHGGDTFKEDIFYTFGRYFVVSMMLLLMSVNINIKKLNISADKFLRFVLPFICLIHLDFFANAFILYTR